MATKHWYYRDPDYGDAYAPWVVITEGTNPTRRWQTCEPSELRCHCEHVTCFVFGSPTIDIGRDCRINPPDDSNPDWWFTGRQWRKEPPRKPSVDREIMHAIPGVLVGALPWPFLVIALGMDNVHPAVWAVVGVLAVVEVLWFARFLAYEVTEGLRIKDWAFRDLAGEKIGWLTSTLGGTAAALVQWLWI